MRHQDGLWGVMMIKATYIRYGTGPCGISGAKAKPRSVQIW